jgi:1-acyl-sn-glycerol-3-phosphate acyltransferase
MRAMISLLFWIATGILTLLMSVLVVICATLLLPFDRKRKIAHTLGYVWSDLLGLINPFWSIKVSGLENVNRKKSYVIVANHQSMADIVAVYRTHMQFKWVAKDELFRIPIFGWSLSMIGYIRLSRGEFGSIKDVYTQAANWLRKDISVLFFPEGTRSKDGQIQSFKNGAFKLAIKEAKPILPIYISDTRNILPRGSWIFNSKVKCMVMILPCIDTAQYSPEGSDRLRDDVRDKLLKAAGQSATVYAIKGKAIKYKD